MILLTENIFSLKGSGFEELNFMLLYKFQILIFTPPFLPKLMDHLEYNKTR